MEIQTDKVLHFVISLLLVVLFFAWSKNYLLSLGITGFVGLAKEAYDGTRYAGGFSLGDLAADAIGMAAGILIIVLCCRFLPAIIEFNG